MRRVPHPSSAPCSSAALALVARRLFGAARPSSPSAASPVPASVVPSESAVASRAPTALTVGLGYIPSVQFAQFYLAQQSGAYARRRPRRDAPEPDRPDLIPKLGQGAVDIGSGDGTSVIPAVSQGIPVVYTSTIYGKFPSVVARQGRLGHQDRGRPQGQEDRHPRQVRLVVDHAPGAARLGGPHAGRRRHRRVPGLRAGRRAPAGRRRRRHRLRQQRADPAAQGGHRARRAHRRRHRAAAGPGPRDRADDARRPSATRSRRSRWSRSTRWTRSPPIPQKGLDATFKAVPDLAADPALQRQILDATIAAWTNPRTPTRTGRSTAPAGSSRSTS